jgi:hypothetical protein
MRKDELVYQDFYQANYTLKNRKNEFMSYNVWVSREPKNYTPSSILYKGEHVLGAESSKVVRVPISKIKPDVLEIYYICIQEKPKDNQFAVVARACAKLRLYWPLRELQSQE